MPQRTAIQRLRPADAAITAISVASMIAVVTQDKAMLVPTVTKQALSKAYQ
jgi:ribonuclease HII